AAFASASRGSGQRKLHVVAHVGPRAKCRTTNLTDLAENDSPDTRTAQQSPSLAQHGKDEALRCVHRELVPSHLPTLTIPIAPFSLLQQEALRRVHHKEGKGYRSFSCTVTTEAIGKQAASYAGSGEVAHAPVPTVQCQHTLGTGDTSQNDKIIQDAHGR
ncbi:unnamed protein product, partial [Lampetra fluviatilis]